MSAFTVSKVSEGVKEGEKKCVELKIRIATAENGLWLPSNTLDSLGFTPMKCIQVMRPFDSQRFGPAEMRAEAVRLEFKDATTGDLRAVTLAHVAVLHEYLTNLPENAPYRQGLIGLHELCHAVSEAYPGQCARVVFTGHSAQDVSVVKSA